MDQRDTLRDIEALKTRFRQAAITHRLLEQADQAIMRAIAEPAGFALVLLYGPTGVGKTKMLSVLADRINRAAPAPKGFPFSGWLHSSSVTPTALLFIEARPPDGSAFNRAYYYKNILTLLGERTYQQQVQIDIHAEQASPKRRPLRGKAAQFNDLPELREAAEEAICRHGVRVILLDEAHHLLYSGAGGTTVTLQEQLEWLKSMGSTTGALHILAGTYDLLNFGKLNGQIARRCLPVHFPRYQLQRPEDCLEFQAALLTLLRKVPLACDAETLVSTYWLYFYECSIGCIGVLKDWLLRAVSTALEEGQTSLTLDWIQDHALPVDIYQQMLLDATQGEEKLSHTESNREHVWRLLQGGELIAPVPPLPPRGTPPNPEPPPAEDVMSRKDTPSSAAPPTKTADTMSPPPEASTTAAQPGDVRPPAQEPASAGQAETEAAPAQNPPKRRRRKPAEPVAENTQTDGEAASARSEAAVSAPIDGGKAASSSKPKRSRRVGEPKPRRYPVGEHKTERGAEAEQT
jgi:hypothetical protein